MLATIFATVSAMALLQPAIVPDSALRHPVKRTASSAVNTVTPGAVSATRAKEPAASDHLATARRAMAAGAFDIARREFTIAATLEREAGKLPVEALTGLAHALYAQAYNLEAAMTMEKLATDAWHRGDADTEAIALADAIWLYTDAGRGTVARNLSKRLRALMKDTPLTVETLQALRTRVS